MLLWPLGTRNINANDNLDITIQCSRVCHARNSVSASIRLTSNWSVWTCSVTDVKGLSDEKKWCGEYVYLRLKLRSIR